MSHFWHEISPYWQAILTLVVSVAVAFISWLHWQTAKKQSETAKKQLQTAEKQAETARNKLRLELFERRIAVYEALMQLAAIAVGKGDITSEQHRTCAIATKGAEFLVWRSSVVVQHTQIDEMPKRFAEFLKIEG